MTGQTFARGRRTPGRELRGLRDARTPDGSRQQRGCPHEGPAPRPRSRLSV